MIFKETWQQVLDGTKTQTRRPVKPGDLGIHQWPGYAELPIEYVLGGYLRRRKWEVGRTYAVQPGRGKKAVGRIRITKIRRERLHEISTQDIKAEGCGRFVIRDHAEKEVADVPKFASLWNSLYRKPYRWEDNPEVWVLEFERTEER